MKLGSCICELPVNNSSTSSGRCSNNSNSCTTTTTTTTATVTAVDAANTTFGTPRNTIKSGTKTIVNYMLRSY